MKAKALWHNTPDQSIIRDVVLAEDSKQVQLTSLYSLISVGTEQMVASGEAPSSLQEQMKVSYMEGSFDLPVKYGYSMVGHYADGHLYHFMHPHQDVCEVDRDVLFQLPTDLHPARAALTSNMETVINAIWDAGNLDNKRIAICGFGGVGALLAMTLNCHHDVEVHVQELDTWKKEKATELGNHHHSEGESYDIIFHTSASSEGLQWSIDHLDNEGRVVELSWYGDRSVDLKLGHTFHYKRLQIISSQVSRIPGHMASQYDYHSRKELAVNYLKNDRYDDLITGLIPFSQSAEFFNQLRQGNQGNGLIWLIQY